MKACRRCGQFHEGPPRAGERVVVLPVQRTVPGWVYAAAPPRGVVMVAGNETSTVTLDSDGSRREIGTPNLKRACGFKPSKPSRRVRTLGRRPPPLADGPWAEQELPL